MLEQAAYGGLRDETMASARERVQALARDGFRVPEIEDRLGLGLTRTEQEVLRPMIRSAVRRARRARVAETMRNHPEWLRRRGADAAPAARWRETLMQPRRARG